jgi:hypothetical protein
MKPCRLIITLRGQKGGKSENHRESNTAKSFLKECENYGKEMIT